MQLSDFDFPLPQELIAQVPSSERAGSRLLHLDGKSGRISDHCFSELARFIGKGDLLVFNDTKVIKARLCGAKDTGGKVEVMVERMLDARRVLAFVRASHAPKIGQRIILTDGTDVMVVGRAGDLAELLFPEDTLAVLDRIGEIPLPPYIDRAATLEDASRFQTVFARIPGAVAAPTAGLHFDEAILTRLEQLGARFAYVTLHVGAGTFQPVRTQNIDEHVMHSEWYRVPEDTVEAVRKARSAGGRVLAVGTTSLRALESAAKDGELRAGIAETRLFIRPGFRFHVVERLLTNFHLPRSTLLMLVAAFAGLDNIHRAYEHAVEQRYRFFSYGDAMLIERAAAAG